MKLCEEQKITIILAVTAIGVILAIFFYVVRVIETLEIVITLIALELMVSVPSLFYLFPIRRRRKEKQQRKLNNEVFKKWKEVIINRDRFQIEYTFKTPINTNSYEQGKRFLTSSKHTQDIHTLWSTLGDLKAKYNGVGNRIQEPVTIAFSGDYPSLKELREFSDSFYGDCFVTSNILKLLDENSLKLVNDKIIDWTKLVHEEKYIDTLNPTFRLVNQDVLIQSKNQNDVDIRRFQNVIEKLKPKITTDIKQLTALYDNISRNMTEFKRRINQLSCDIDAHI
jgi:hypothetical protein